MHWQKRGKIFDPTDDVHFNAFEGFAQSPQAIELEDRIRVYFSIRKRDSTGKYLSHVSFIDFDKLFDRIIDYPQQEVIPLGDLGTFDEHGIFPFSPVQVGSRIYAYTCGWSRRISVPVETSTGLAFSDDGGVTFQKYAKGPVLSSSLHEPFLVGDSFVIRHKGTFYMWYIFGIRWMQREGGGSPERIYKIGHARSDDGVEWDRWGHQIIPDALGDQECQALPSVVYWNGKFRMVFCYRHAFDFRTNPENAYRLGYAESTNLENWIRMDEKIGGLRPTSGGDWDSQMMCYPNLFVSGNRLHLLYNGNEFGRYGFGLACTEHDNVQAE